MSDTDKTKPYKVKLKQNPQWRRERHDHRDGICDLKFGNTRVNNCFFVVKKSLRSKFYQDRFGWFHSYVAERNGSARMKLRVARREMLKMDIDDIVDFDVENPRHRHSAVWENW